MAGNRPEQRSQEAQRYRKLYWTARWRRISAAQLAKQPLCEYCLQRGRIVSAVHCDHIEPHKGDPDKFWSGPFQSLCGHCHNSIKQSEERLGYRKGSTADGRPVDASHPWNKQERRA